MPVEKISWEFLMIAVAVLVVIIIIIFYVAFSSAISENSCQWINGVIDKFSLGSSWFRLGLPHVC